MPRAAPARRSRREAALRGRPHARDGASDADGKVTAHLAVGGACGAAPTPRHYDPSAGIAHGTDAGAPLFRDTAGDLMPNGRGGAYERE